MDQRAIFYVTGKNGKPKPIFKIERDPKTVMRPTGEPGVRWLAIFALVSVEEHSSTYTVQTFFLSQKLLEAPDY